jgi:hypothetical protein
MPLLPRPTTMKWSEAIRLMLLSIPSSAQPSADQHQNHGDDPKRTDHARLRPAFESQSGDGSAPCGTPACRSV